MWVFLSNFHSIFPRQQSVLPHGIYGISLTQSCRVPNILVQSTSHGLAVNANDVSCRIEYFLAENLCKSRHSISHLFIVYALDTRQSVASECNPYENSPFACKRFKWCLPNSSISALVIHLLSLINMISMNISSSLCLKFPLLVLRYSGIEDTNIFKWIMRLPRRHLKCFFFSSIMYKKLYTNKINHIFTITRTKEEDNANIILLLNSAYKKLKNKR